jgi:hypothetical protein
VFSSVSNMREVLVLPPAVTLIWSGICQVTGRGLADR